MERFSTNCPPIDDLLQGGIEQDCITLVYGPAGSGKTSLCMLAATAIAQNKKVLYVDTEGGFSLDRFGQLSDEHLLQNIIFLRPMNFEEQHKTISQVVQSISTSVGLVIVDTITHLYRTQLGKHRIYDVNRELGLQVQLLAQIARKHHIPVLLANQVYANFDQPNQIRMVGGDFLKYGAKCLIELQKGRGSMRRALLKKHRSIPEDNAVMFKIINEGFAMVEQ